MRYYFNRYNYLFSIFNIFENKNHRLLVLIINRNKFCNTNYAFEGGVY